VTSLLIAAAEGSGLNVAGDACATEMVMLMPMAASAAAKSLARVMIPVSLPGLLTVQY
jgi:hypothetical protein